MSKTINTPVKLACKACKKYTFIENNVRKCILLNTETGITRPDNCPILTRSLK